MAEIRNIFDVAGRSMAAQMVRLNTVASNLANAGAISGNKENAFRALKPVFETKFADALKRTGLSTVDAVDVNGWIAFAFCILSRLSPVLLTLYFLL